MLPTGTREGARVEDAAGKKEDGRETGDSGLGGANIGMQTMVTNLVRKALKQEIKDTKPKKQRDSED